MRKKARNPRSNRNSIQLARENCDSENFDYTRNLLMTSDTSLFFTNTKIPLLSCFLSSLCTSTSLPDYNVGHRIEAVVSASGWRAGWMVRCSSPSKESGSHVTFPVPPFMEVCDVLAPLLEVLKGKLKSHSRMCPWNCFRVLRIPNRSMQKSRSTV